MLCTTIFTRTEIRTTLAHTPHTTHTHKHTHIIDCKLTQWGMWWMVVLVVMVGADDDAQMTRRAIILIGGHANIRTHKHFNSLARERFGTLAQHSARQTIGARN